MPVITEVFRVTMQNADEQLLKRGQRPRAQPRERFISIFIFIFIFIFINWPLIQLALSIYSILSVLKSISE